jgi:predicted nucleic acid-binding protein
LVKHLPDTNVLSEPVRSVPNPAVLKRLRANEAKLAIATVHGLTLVTANARDFRHVEGITVENWLG